MEQIHVSSLLRLKGLQLFRDQITRWPEGMLKGEKGLNLAIDGII